MVIKPLPSTYRVGSPQRGGRGGDPAASHPARPIVDLWTSPAKDGGATDPARTFPQLETQAVLDDETSSKTAALTICVGVVCTIAGVVWFAGSAVAQPFPGYAGGPMVRHENGAVSEVTDVGNGSASVNYYDGTSVVQGSVPYDVEAGVDLPAEGYHPEWQAIVDGSATQIEVVGSSGNLDCRDSNGDISNDPVDRAGCTLTGVDTCRIRPSPPRSNAPCFQVVGGGVTLRMYEWGPDTGGTGTRLNLLVCPDDTPDGADYNTCGGNGEPGYTWYTDRPMPFDPGVSEATAIANFNTWANDCFASGSFAGNCEMAAYPPWPWEQYDPTVTGDGSPVLPVATNLPPVNVPVPAPDGLDGATMNPGGYQEGGTGDTGGFDGGGNGGGGDTGTGDGITSVEGTIDCEGCDGTTDTDSVDLPLLSWAAPGWLPAACPAPMTVQVFQSSITIMDYSYVCGFAGVIKIIVLVGSSIVALRIVFEGVR